MFRSASNALQVIEDFKKRRISLWRLDLGDDCSGKRADRHHPGGCAQFERGLISERIKDAKRAPAATGCISPAPVSSVADGKLVPNEREKQVLARREPKAAG